MPEKEFERVFYDLDDIPYEAVGDVVRIGNSKLFRVNQGNASIVSKFDWTCKYCKCQWFLSKVIEQHESHCPKCHRFIGFFNKNNENKEKV